MTLSTVLLATAAAFAAVALATYLVYSYWRVRSEVKRALAGKPTLKASRAILCRAHACVGDLDLAGGPGGFEGRPVPPYRFLEEHTTGSNPCVSVRDARGRVWRVKWGDEVHAETFASRIAWAAGFFVETNYFVPSGTIEDAAGLARAGRCVAGDGSFVAARFELDEPDVIKHFDEHSWAWNDNPFVGTPELNGLKIVMMLLSNWDNKDVRDVARGSNTAIFEYPLAGHREARYLIIDWGGALGPWGSSVLSRGRWDWKAFAAQNDEFIVGVSHGRIEWGYRGQRTADAVNDVGRSDARWLCERLAPMADDQIASGLRASGANEEEIAGFTRALRDRLNRLCDAAILTLVLICSFSPRAAAQQPAPPPRGEGKLDLALVATSGNTNTQSIGAAGELILRPDSWVFTMRTAFVHNRAEGVISAKSLRSQARAALTIRPAFELFSQYGYLTDRFSGVVHRHTYDAGLSYRVVQTPRHELSAEGTLGFLNEERTVEDRLDTGSASVGTHYELKLSESSAITDELQVAVDLHEDGTWRINHVAAATARLTSMVALKLSSALRFVHEPVPGFRRTDTVASASVVMTF